jgi:hypothetical protein
MLDCIDTGLEGSKFLSRKRREPAFSIEARASDESFAEI